MMGYNGNKMVNHQLPSVGGIYWYVAQTNDGSGNGNHYDELRTGICVYSDLMIQW